VRGSRSVLLEAFPVALIVVILASPLPTLGGIAGSLHDLSMITADEETDLCAHCHVPHGAQGERLWKQAPSGPKTGWGSRTVAQLCYMCHNATGGGCGGHDVTQTAYDDLSHGFLIAGYPAAPDGSPEVMETGIFLPYVTTLMDCTTCHDPHDNTYPPFLREASIDRLCQVCHHRVWPGAVGTGNLAPDGRSYHPVGIGYQDLDGNLETRLEPFPDPLQVVTASGAWVLGPHRQGWQRGDGGIGCQTCHPIHGRDDPETGLGVPPLPGLLRFPAAGASSSPLCQACHQGGEAPETVGDGTDHPINVHTPSTDPLFASGVMGYPEGWPSGTAKEPICASCHDVHGGLGGTSLLRTGGNAAWWCLSCHQATAIVPPWHHSSIYNDDDGVTLASVLSCEDCHGLSGTWRAHNGFTAFAVTVSNTDSALCELCHLPANPLEFTPEAHRGATGRSVDFASATFPALHGRVGGTDSHLVDAIDDDSTFNTRIFTGVWTRSGGVSEYGSSGEMLCESCHGILVNSGPLTAEANPLRGGWQANLLLEPYEDNDPGTGKESPDHFPGRTGDALCRACHTDDKVGYVHYPGAHTIPGFTYLPTAAPQGRMTQTLITFPNDPLAEEGCPEISSADRTGATLAGFIGAPGAFSYPALNELDCDSCHRPHGADHRAMLAGYGHVIVEFSEGQPKSDTCQECHDTQKGCR
jgi:predicted CXXCH cytochrome family protein